MSTRFEGLQKIRFKWTYEKMPEVEEYVLLLYKSAALGSKSYGLTYGVWRKNGWWAHTGGDEFARFPMDVLKWARVQK